MRVSMAISVKFVKQNIMEGYQNGFFVRRFVNFKSFRLLNILGKSLNYFVCLIYLCVMKFKK